MNRKKVPQEKIDTIIEAISLTPTSSGLQPFEIIVITNQEMKEMIRPAAWNPSVITDCSHLFIFAAWDTYTPERINKMFDLTNEIRGFKNEVGRIIDRCCWIITHKEMQKSTLIMPQNKPTSLFLKPYQQLIFKG